MDARSDPGVDDSPPPPRPQAETRAALGFTREKRMVRWLSPSQLWDTGRRALFAVIISSYSDKREIEASLPSPGIVDRSDRPELWIDFVSDLGDGFNPTYTVARLLAAPTLEIGHENRQGGILIMGGDQTYPVASLRRYQDQLVGPFRAAMPYRERDQPELFAIPGNHDWFDGLTSFMRVFCQQEWIGGWTTAQTRSYFAIRLPHHWWLLGIDIQFENYIDAPQLQYFLREVSPKLGPEDAVIVCVAKPSWVDANAAEPHLDPDLYTTLDYFERKVIRPSGARVLLALSGDRHHYARYAEDGGERQRFTCGGAGAFLSETHGLPEEIQVPHPGSSDPAATAPPVTYRLARTYPEGSTSRGRAWLGIWALLWRNDGFPLFIGVIGWLFAFMGRGGIVADDQGLWDVPALWWRNTLSLLIGSGLLIALIRFTKARGPRAWMLGIGHLAAHVAAMIATIWAVSTLLGGVEGDWHIALTLLGTLIVYGVIGTELFALYLLVADLFRVNRTELFAAMRIEDQRSFLRLRVHEEGCTVYPIKVETVPRSWRLVPDGGPEAPWFEPVDEAITPELIEVPITISRGSGS